MNQMAKTPRGVQRPAPRARAAPRRVSFRLRPALTIACFIAFLGIAVAGRSLKQSSVDSTSSKPFAGLAQTIARLSAPSPAATPSAAPARPFPAAVAPADIAASMRGPQQAVTSTSHMEPSAQQALLQQQAAPPDMSSDINAQSELPAYAYDATAATSVAQQPSVAYDSSGRAFLVMPVDAATAQQAAAVAVGNAMPVPSYDPSAAAAMPATATPQADATMTTQQAVAAQQRVAVQPGMADAAYAQEPRIQAASGPIGGWIQEKFERLHEQAPAEAPQVVVVPAPQPAVVPQQVAAAATPIATTPTVIGGPMRIVTSNPIAISTPVKTVNPVFTKTFGGGGSVLAGAAGLLGSLFPANQHGR